MCMCACMYIRMNVYVKVCVYACVHACMYVYVEFMMRSGTRESDENVDVCIYV